MTFGRYALERVVATGFVLWAALTGLFFALHWNGLLFRQYERGQHAATDDYFWRSYWDHLGRLLRGDLGHTLLDPPYRTELGRASLEAASVSVSLVLAGLVLGLLVAVALQPLAWRRRPFVIVGAVLFGLALPGMQALQLYAGYCDFLGLSDRPARCGLGDWAGHLLLPGLVIALWLGPVYARVLRSARSRVAGAETAESRRSVMRLERLLLAKLLGRDFGFALGLCGILEGLVGFPGLGGQIREGLGSFDRPSLEAAIIVATAIALAVQLAVDLVCGWLEPELRLP